jgi:hypothetical protein
MSALSHGLRRALRGIRAYHGSPHDFDRFSLAHIGKGEGAQAYGHGLYFAEAEDVARNYRKGLSITHGVRQREMGDAISSTSPQVPEQLKTQILYDVQWHPESITDDYAGNLIGRHRRLFNFDPTPTDLQNVQKAVEAAKRARDGAGRMYEVNINASSDDFLDWDAPVASSMDDMERFAARFDATSPATRNALEDWGFKRAQAGYAMPDGEDIVREFGSSRRHLTDTLRGAGFPGIRYLDAGSRGAGEGSRNYVVFDDSIIDILRKYGIAGLGVGTGGALGLREALRDRAQSA